MCRCMQVTPTSHCNAFYALQIYDMLQKLDMQPGHSLGWKTSRILRPRPAALAGLRLAAVCVKAKPQAVSPCVWGSS